MSYLTWNMTTEVLGRYLNTLAKGEILSDTYNAIHAHAEKKVRIQSKDTYPDLIDKWAK